MAEKPVIACLIGSSRFKETFTQVGHMLEVNGYLVLAMTFFGHADNIHVSDSERSILETIDRHRIDLADEVRVIDASRDKCTQCNKWVESNGRSTWCDCLDSIIPYWTRVNYIAHPYVGESTKKEIDYALSLHKPVLYYSNNFEPKLAEDLRCPLDRHTWSQVDYWNKQYYRHCKRCKKRQSRLQEDDWPTV